MFSVQHPALPTFFLHPNVSGIVSVEQAARLASTITGREISPSHIVWHDTVAMSDMPEGLVGLGADIA